MNQYQHKFISNIICHNHTDMMTWWWDDILAGKITHFVLEYNNRIVKDEHMSESKINLNCTEDKHWTKPDEFHHNTNDTLQQITVNV